MAEDDVNPIQIDRVEIFDKDARIFKSWGSVEVRDREGDLLPMSEFRKIMPVIMKRGGLLMDRHTNTRVGRILNYEFLMKDTPEGPRLGVMITGEVFKDYDHDDMVWEGIKSGVYKGLSFGGRNKMKDVKFDKSGLTNILTKLEGDEFSFVPGMGNQEATMEEINYLAKGSDTISGSVKKVYDADGLHIHSSDNLTGEHTHPEIEKFVEELRQEIIRLDMRINEVENPNEFIELSKEKVKKPRGTDYTDDEDNKKTSIEKDLSSSTTTKNSDKYIKESDLNKDMEEAEIKKQIEMIEKNSSAIEAIAKSLGEVLELLKVKKEAEEEDEENQKKKKEAEEEDEEDQKKKKEGHEDDEDELEKANGSEGEKKVVLPKVPAEETGGGEPAQGGEGEDVKFIEKVESAVAEEVKKQLAGMVNKSASTPRPAHSLVNKGEDGVKVPTNTKDVANLIKKRSQR